MNNFSVLRFKKLIRKSYRFLPKPEVNSKEKMRIWVLVLSWRLAEQYNGEQYAIRMISLLYRDCWKILKPSWYAILQEMDKEKAKIIESKWTVDNEMVDRSELSEELANFCPQYPIYQVKTVDVSLTSTRVETEGKLSTEKFEMRLPKTPEG